MLNEQFVTMEIGKAKNIALVAHDGKKQELVEWCDRNKDILKGHFLCGTGTTAKLIAERTGLPVKGYCSGPLGGDQQIGAKIAALTASDNVRDMRREPLSPREREIVVCIVKGMTNKQIADKLCISTHTVITHRRNIAAKLQIHSAAGLTIYAIVNKLVELSEIKDTIDPQS